MIKLFYSRNQQNDIVGQWDRTQLVCNHMTNEAFNSEVFRIILP